MLETVLALKAIASGQKAARNRAGETSKKTGSLNPGNSRCETNPGSKVHLCFKRKRRELGRERNTGNTRSQSEPPAAAGPRMVRRQPAIGVVNMPSRNKTGSLNPGNSHDETDTGSKPTCALNARGGKMGRENCCAAALAWPEGMQL